MSDADLLALKTEVAYDMAAIENQIRFPEGETDPDWVRRAGSAQHIRQHGIAAIKNILAERTAERSDAPAVPLVRWMEVTHSVVAAAMHLAESVSEDEDDVEAWEALDRALTHYAEFSVSSEVLREAMR